MAARWVVEMAEHLAAVLVVDLVGKKAVAMVELKVAR